MLKESQPIKNLRQFHGSCLPPNLHRRPLWTQTGFHACAATLINRNWLSRSKPCPHLPWSAAFHVIWASDLQAGSVSIRTRAAAATTRSSSCNAMFSKRESPGAFYSFAWSKRQTCTLPFALKLCQLTGGAEIPVCSAWSLSTLSVVHRAPGSSLGMQASSRPPESESTP